jgi:hypothetical protein
MASCASASGKKIQLFSSKVVINQNAQNLYIIIGRHMGAIGDAIALKFNTNNNQNQTKKYNPKARGLKKHKNLDN